MGQQCDVLGIRLTIARRRRELTLEQLAERVQRAPGYLSTLHTGRKTNPSRETLEALARELGVTVGWLLGETGDATL